MSCPVKIEEPDNGDDDSLDQSEEELAAQYGPRSAFSVGAVWFEAIFDNSDWERAWNVMALPFRLARAQAWIWNNRTHPDFHGKDRDELAGRLLDRTDEMWPEFAKGELHLMKGAWPDCSTRTWGAASRPRLVGPARELLLWIENGGEVMRISGPTKVVALRLLMEYDEGVWSVANIGHEVPPVPGWPPELYP